MARTIKTGDRLQGQWLIQVPQPIQGSSSAKAASFAVKKVMPEVLFSTGKFVSAMEAPIIGPPDKIFTVSGDTVPSVISFTIVPTGTRRFLGSVHPWPETVRGRSIRGFPSRNASEIAHSVATLLITHPTSIGSPLAGISRLRTAFTIVFSLPWGYFVLHNFIAMEAP